MNVNTKFTKEQVVLLAFMGVVGNMVYIHTWIDNNADRAAWLAALIGIVLIIPLLIWIFFLGNLYPEGTIFDIIAAGLGKFTSSLVSILFIFINLALAITHLNMFTQMLNVFFLQNTPPWVIMLFLVCMGVIFTYGDVLSFARLVEILAVLGALNYFIGFLFIFPRNFHVEYFIPIFDTSLLGFIKGIIFMMFTAAECLIPFMVYVRFIPDPAKHYMWGVKGVILGSTIFSFAIFIIIAMMSPELAKRIAYGGVNAARLIRIGEFIQGLEVFIFVTYQFIAIGKVTTCLYCSWTSLKNIFNNKKPVLLLIIASLMILIPSIWLSSYNRAYFLAVFLAKFILLPFSVLTLLLASLSIRIKNKRNGSVRK